MKRSRNPDETRRKIVEATKRILSQGGYFTRFSLAEVAKEAGVSKGGLLHHFPDKESLLRGVSEDMIAQFEAQLADELSAEDAQQPGKFTRAYIRAALTNNPNQPYEVSPVLLAFLRSSDNVEAVKTRFDHWHQQTKQDGLDLVTATIVRLAVDGLLYTEIIDAQPIDPTLRSQVIQRLLNLAQ